MNRNASRSRSRTPPVREKPKSVVNMLDLNSIAQAKDRIRRKPFSERVTGGPSGGAQRFSGSFEGAGERRSVFNRVSGGRFDGNRSFNDGNRSFNDGNRSFNDGNRSFNDGNRSFNDGNRSFKDGNRSFNDGNRSFNGLNRSFNDGNRSFNSGDRSFNAGDRNLNDGDRSFNAGYRSSDEGNRSSNEGGCRVTITGDALSRTFPDRRSSHSDHPQKDDDHWFGIHRRGGEEGCEKRPEMKLIDPQDVPRSERFFTHDDRSGEDEWRGRDMYDPRRDTGRYNDHFDRDRRGGRDYGNRDYGNNRRFDRDDRDRRDGGTGGSGWDGFARQNFTSYGGSGSRFGSRSGSDGVWVHDKYLELEAEDNELREMIEAKKGDEVIEVKEKEAGKEDDDVLFIDKIESKRTVE